MDYPYQTAFETALAQEGRAPLTIKGYHDTLTRFFAFLAGQLGDEPQVKDITEADVRSFFIALQESKPLTLATYNKHLSYLNRYFAFLLTHHRITSYPTLNLHGALPTNSLPFSTDWLAKLDRILSDQHLHIYTRLTLFVVSRGFQVGEFLQPGFAASFRELAAQTPAEEKFLEDFAAFHAPLAQQQGCDDPFLKLRINRANPRLSNAGLHKFLKPDEAYLGFKLAPKLLYQGFVYATLAKYPQANDQELAARLRMSPATLAYYRQRRYQLMSQGRLPKEE